MGLSSDVIWHQTTKEGFQKILKSKQILFSYSLEKFNLQEGYLGIAFPMISMCNLPLSEFSSYNNKYGGYTIGFSKEWGNRHGFTPVWYCNPSSDIWVKLNKNLMDLQYQDRFRLALELLAYLKHPEGSLPRRQYKSYRFEDEREVRIIAKEDDLKEANYAKYLVESSYHRFKSEHKNKSILNFGVRFDIQDIGYLIVKQDITFARTLLGVDGKEIPIFTSSQVMNDIIGVEHDVIDIPDKVQRALELMQRIKLSSDDRML